MSVPEGEPAAVSPGRLRALGRSLSVLAVLLVVSTLVWGVICWNVVSHPTTDTATKADAIVLLGPAVSGNLDLGRQLVDEGISDQLVISVPDGSPTECATGVAGAQVLCLKPDPVNTRGEAQLIGRLADQHGWKKLVIVTWREHIARARLLIGRCFPGRLQLVAYDSRTEFVWQLADWIHQTGGWVKATVLQRSC